MKGFDVRALKLAAIDALGMYNKIDMIKDVRLSEDYDGMLTISVDIHPDKGFFDRLAVNLAQKDYGTTVRPGSMAETSG